MSEQHLSLNGIRAILFDFDGTLRHSRPSYNHALFEFAAELGVPISEEKRREALRWAHYYFAQSPELLDDTRTFPGDRERFMTNYVRRYLIVCGCASERAASLAPSLFHGMAQMLQQEDWIEPAVPGTLEKLKGAGFTLGVVSNRQEPFQDRLNALGLTPYFEFALASGEVNSWKPDEEIFRHAVECAGTCPACTMYVGDNYYADVVGARRAGLQPVLLDPEGLFPDADCPVIDSLTELELGIA